MVDGRDADAGGVKVQVCSQQFFCRREVGDGVFFACGGCRGWVVVYDCDEVCAGEFAVDAEVVAPEGSGADDGYAQWGLAGHYFERGASTASRQRA